MYIYFINMALNPYLFSPVMDIKYINKDRTDNDRNKDGNVRGDEWTDLSF